MKKLAIETGVKVDTAMYFARVITFKFGSNGIGVSFFRQFKNNAQLINFILFTTTEKAALVNEQSFCYFSCAGGGVEICS